MLRSNRMWRPSWWVGKRYYAWHLTFEDEPLIGAAAAYRQQFLAGFSGLELVPSRWLHLTLNGFGLRSEVDAGAVDRAVSAVRQSLSALPPVEVCFDGWSTADAAVSLVPADPGPVAGIRDRIRAGLDDAGARHGEPADGFVPHVSLAYVLEDQPAGPVEAALRAGETGPVRIVINQVSLIEMYREEKVYRWEQVATVPLAATVRQP